MRVDTSFTVVVSVTSWRESLSPVTMTVSHPAAVSFTEMVPMRSSASQPSSSYPSQLPPAPGCPAAGETTAYMVRKQARPPMSWGDGLGDEHAVGPHAQIGEAAA